MLASLNLAQRIFLFHSYMYSTYSLSQTLLDGNKAHSSLITHMLLGSILYLAAILNILFPLIGFTTFGFVLNLIIIIFNTLMAHDAIYIEPLIYAIGGLPSYLFFNTIYRSAQPYINMLPSKIDFNYLHAIASSIIQRLPKSMQNIAQIFIMNITLPTLQFLSALWHQFKHAQHTVNQRVDTQYIWKTFLYGFLTIYHAASISIIALILLQNPMLSYDNIAALSAHSFFYVYYIFECHHRQYIKPALSQFITLSSGIIHSMNTLYLSSGIVLLSIQSLAEVLSNIYKYAYSQDKANYAARVVYAVLLTLYYIIAVPLYHLIDYSIFFLERSELYYKNIVNNTITLCERHHINISDPLYRLTSFIYQTCMNIFTIAKYVYLKPYHMLFKRHTTYTVSMHDKQIYDNFISRDTFFKRFKKFDTLESSFHYDFLHEIMNALTLPKESIYRRFYKISHGGDIQHTLLELGRSTGMGHYVFQVNSLFKHTEELPIVDKKIDEHIPHIMTYITHLLKHPELLQTSNQNNTSRLVDIKEEFSTLIWDECTNEDSLKHGQGLLDSIPYAKQNSSTTKLIKNTQEKISQYVNDNLHIKSLSTVQSLSNSLFPLLSDDQAIELHTVFENLLVAIDGDTHLSKISDALHSIKNKMAIADQEPRRNYKYVKYIKNNMTMADRKPRHNCDYTSFIQDCDKLNNHDLSVFAQSLYTYSTLDEKEQTLLKKRINYSIERIRSNPELKIKQLCIQAASLISQANWCIFIGNLLHHHKLTPSDAINLSGGRSMDTEVFMNKLRTFWTHMQSYIHGSLEQLPENHLVLQETLFTQYLKQYSESSLNSIKSTVDNQPKLAIALYKILKKHHDHHKQYLVLTKQDIRHLTLYILSHTVTQSICDKNVLSTMCQNYLHLLLRSLRSCSTGMSTGLREEYNKFMFSTNNPSLSDSADLHLRGSLQYSLDNNPLITSVMNNLSQQLDGEDGVHTNNARSNISKFPVGLGSSDAFFEAQLLTGGISRFILKHLTSLACIYDEVSEKQLIQSRFSFIQNIYQQHEHSSSFNIPTIGIFEADMMDLIGTDDPAELQRLYSSDEQAANKDLSDLETRQLFIINIDPDNIPLHWKGITLALLLKHGYMMPKDKNDALTLSSSQFLFDLNTQSFITATYYICKNTTSYVITLSSAIVNLILHPLIDIKDYAYDRLMHNAYLQVHKKFFSSISHRYGLNFLMPHDKKQSVAATNQETNPSSSTLNYLFSLPKHILIAACDITSLACLPITQFVFTETSAASHEFASQQDYLNQMAYKPDLQASEHKETYDSAKFHGID